MNYRQQYKNHIVNTYGEPTTLEQLFEIVRLEIDNQSDDGGPIVTGLAWDIRYNEKVSNSHECPINGQKKNWSGCDENITRNYPGFTGRVWIRIRENSGIGWTGDYFKKSLTYSGTGGFGNYDGLWKAISSARFKTYGLRHSDEFPALNIYSWDYKIFSDDFPLIVDTWVKENLFNVIQTNKTKIHIVSNLVWEDPATKQLDDAFMEWFDSNDDTTGFRSVQYA